MRSRRLIGVLLMLLLAAGSLGLAGCGATAGHWEEGRVSLDWRAGWRPAPVVEGMSWPLGRLIDSTLLCALEREDPYRRVELVRLDLAPGATLQSAFDEAYAALAQKYGSSLREVTGGTTTVDGSPALVNSYEVPHGEPYNKCEDVWVESEGSLYVLAARGGVWDFEEKVLPDFEAMLQSLQIGGGQ